MLTPLFVNLYSKQYLSKSESVLISTGAYTSKTRNRTRTKFSGRGISYCATCDGPFFKDEHIVVVGGGDTVLEEANFLTKFGKSVKIIHRRDAFKSK